MRERRRNGIDVTEVEEDQVKFLFINSLIPEEFIKEMPFVFIVLQFQVKTPDDRVNNRKDKKAEVWFAHTSVAFKFS